jgi:dihydroorotase
MSLLVKGGRVVDPANGLDTMADVLVADGRIAKVGKGLKVPEGTEVVAAAGKVVCPGLIDIHVHFREPGYEYKETIATGTRAAAAGGFTAVACMANTLPVNDNRSVTDFIMAKARVEGVVRVYPIGAVTRGLKGKELAEMAELAEAGCVAFSDDGQCVMNAEIYRRAMEYALPFGVPIISHAEDEHLAHRGAMHEGLVSTELGLLGQPWVAEDVMVARDILLAELTGAHVHIAHISTAGAVRLVREGKARGVRVTAEVTPHHLVLTDEAVRSLDPNVKMNPPLRAESDRAALIDALRDGTIEAIATDHAPHARHEKDVPFEAAPFGVTGLETAFAVLYTELVEPGILALPTVLERMSAGPARIFGLHRPRIATGERANVVLIDLNGTTRVTENGFRSRSVNSWLLGRALKSRVAMTLAGGAVAYE